jgi:hypothetical protein
MLNISCTSAHHCRHTSISIGHFQSGELSLCYQQLKSMDFWVITRRRVVIFYRRFGLGLLTREDGTDTLSRNIGKQLPHDAA